METTLDGLNLTDEARKQLSEWYEQVYDFEHDVTGLPDEHDKWDAWESRHHWETAQLWKSYGTMVTRLLQLGGNVHCEDGMLHGYNDRIAYGVIFRDNQFSIHT